MKLTPEQSAEILQKTNEFRKKPCPYCGSTHGYEFDPEPFDIIAANDIPQALNKGIVSAIPVLVGVCKECGYVISFSLKKLGFI